MGAAVRMSLFGKEVRSTDFEEIIGYQVKYIVE